MVHCLSPVQPRVKGARLKKQGMNSAFVFHFHFCNHASLLSSLGSVHGWGAHSWHRWQCCLCAPMMHLADTLHVAATVAGEFHTPSPWALRRCWSRIEGLSKLITMQLSLEAPHLIFGFPERTVSKRTV
eukprot:3576626-Amphidinium_carterae.1